MVDIERYRGLSGIYMAYIEFKGIHIYIQDARGDGGAWGSGWGGGFRRVSAAFEIRLRCV